MPHVVIDGPASIEQFYQQFEPIDVREADTILKIKDIFLNTEKMKALLECVVVEKRFPQTFYMIVSQKANTITVRLDPLTDPEKNNGVKRLLALVAYTLKSQEPACRYLKHNLTGFLVQ